jgi:murein DD-endopeptidase MepM/ murein hydrolase activator NlpD
VATLLGVRLSGGSAAQAPAPALRVSALSLPGLAASVPAASVTRLDAGAVPLTVVSPPVHQETVLRATDTTQQALSVLGQRVASASAAPTGGTERVTASRQQEQTIFFRYEVLPGDTVTGIAARFGIDPKYIVWNNVDIISDQDALAVGSRLQIPALEGILHQVRVGETLTEIAEKYDAKTADIVNFSPNGLAGNPNLLREGSTILVPGGKIAPRPAPSLRPSAPAPAQQPAAPAQRPAAPSPGRARFIWPVVNNVTSFFGPSHPLGIDIEAPHVPVAAAAAGQVVFAGGDACCSYGLNVVIRHEEGLETRYAHLSSIAVQLGQFVEQGATLGISGATGRATGAHLHFEVWLNGNIVNPMGAGYLP